MICDLDLAKKYLGKYVTYFAKEDIDPCFKDCDTISIFEDVCNEKIRIINKNQSAVFYYKNKNSNKSHVIYGIL